MKKNKKEEIYTIKIQNEKDADFIINLLEQERIPYKVKLIKQKYGCGFLEMTPTYSSNNGYNIELHTDFTHYEYFIRVVCDEQAKYGLTIPVSDISVSVLDLKPELQKKETSTSTPTSTSTSTPTTMLPLTMLMMMSLSSPLNNFDKEQGKDYGKQEQKQKQEQNQKRKNKKVKKSMLKKIIDWMKEG